MSDQGEVTVMTITVTKVLRPDGEVAVRWDSGNSQDSYMDHLALLEYAKAMIAHEAIKVSEAEE